MKGGQCRGTESYVMRVGELECTEYVRATLGEDTRDREMDERHYRVAERDLVRR